MVQLSDLYVDQQTRIKKLKGGQKKKALRAFSSIYDKYGLPNYDALVALEATDPAKYAAARVDFKKLNQSIGKQISANKGGGFFSGGLGSILKTLAPAALSIAFPGVGTALGAALGAGATWAPIIGNSLIGAATGGLTGGGVKGALTGALVGGASSALAPKIGALSKTIGGADQIGQNITWNAPGSAATNAASSIGKNIAWNAAPTNGIGSGIKWNDTLPTFGSSTSNSAGSSILDRVLGDDPLSTLKKGLDIASAFKDPEDKMPEGTLSQQDIAEQMQQRQEQENRTNEKFIQALNAPPLNRPQSNNQIDYSTYGQTPQNAENMFFSNPNPQQPPLTLKHGGLVQGPGGPTDDLIEARLSDGEYVMPARAVKAIGKGSSKKGAKKLKQVGKKALSKKDKSGALASVI